MTEEKVCCACGVKKPTTAFPIRGSCRECVNKRQRELYAQKTPEQLASLRATRKAYSQANKETLKLYYKAYQKARRNTPEYRQKQREHYAKNIEYFRAKTKIKNMTTARKAYSAKYREENKEKWDAHRKQYNRRPDIKIKSVDVERKRRAALLDNYVRILLIRDTSLTTKDIPQSLVEVKRLQVLIKRSLQNEERR